MCRIIAALLLLVVLCPRVRAEDQPNPLLYLVTARWCPHCRVMQKRLEARYAAGELGDVQLCILDIDDAPDVVKSAMRGSTRLPQLILYRPVTRLIGEQTDQQVNDLIKGK